MLFVDSSRSSPLLIAARSLSARSKSSDNENGKSDAPVKFMESKAQTWRARESRSGYSAQDEPWYQMYVILASLSVFMIYFFILREENDIDQRLGSTLYDHIEGLEEAHLEMAIQYNRDNGLSTKELEARLIEVKSASAKAQQ